MKLNVSKGYLFLSLPEHLLEHPRKIRSSSVETKSSLRDPLKSLMCEDLRRHLHQSVENLRNDGNERDHSDESDHSCTRLSDASVEPYGLVQPYSDDVDHCALSKEVT